MFLWFTILGCIFIALAVVGNALVIGIIAARRRLHTVANCFVMSLAVADFCIGVYSVSCSIACSVETSCEDKLAGFLVGAFFFVSSITSLCVMTVERWVAIVWPLKYINFMTRRCVSLLISVAWILPLILFRGPFVFSLSDDNRKMFLTPNQWSKAYMLFVFGAIDLVPCLILLVTTTHILFIARKLSRQTAVLLAQVNFNHLQGASARFSQSQRKTGEFSSSAKAIGVVVALFLVCHLLHFLIILCHFFQVSSLPKEIHCLFKLLLIANSALNPVAYSFLKRDIKAEVKRLLRFNVEQS